MTGQFKVKLDRVIEMAKAKGELSFDDLFQELLLSPSYVFRLMCSAATVSNGELVYAPAIDDSGVWLTRTPKKLYTRERYEELKKKADERWGRLWSSQQAYWKRPS